MDLSNLGLFRLMQRKMNWLTQRQEVLSENVANADSPNYRARDVVPFDFKSAVRDINRVKKLGLAETQPGHITNGGSSVVDHASAWLVRENKDRKAYETSPSRNGVVLEDQMAKVTQTASDYQMITNLYRKQVNLIKTAIGRSPGA